MTHEQRPVVRVKVVQPSSQAGRQAARQPGSQAARQIARQIDRQIARQIARPPAGLARPEKPRRIFSKADEGGSPRRLWQYVTV